jgi:hypothetical protein
VPVLCTWGLLAVEVELSSLYGKCREAMLWNSGRMESRLGIRVLNAPLL